jgi:hypothetical protein
MPKIYSFHLWMALFCSTELFSFFLLLKYHLDERVVIHVLDSAGLSYDRESSIVFRPEDVLPMLNSIGNAHPSEAINPPFWLELGTHIVNRMFGRIDPRLSHWIRPQEWPIYNPIATLSSRQNAKIPEGFLNQVKKLKYLQVVKLDSDLFDDEALLSLKKSKFLWDLTLTGDTFTDRGFSVIATMPRLEILFTKETQITDKGIEFLRGHPTLRVVYLDGSKVTDECLKIFETIPNLELLTLYETKVTKHGEAITRLRNRLPNVEIFCEE